MKITEVRIKLIDDPDDRLQAFCSITFDNCFVIRDLKIIEGGSGPFVAMPSRKLTMHCDRCGCKNHLRANNCNQCGGRLKQSDYNRDSTGRVKLYADIAHPINSACREQIQDVVIQQYQQELQLAAKPGYKSRYDESYEATDFASQPIADIQSSVETPSEPVEKEPNSKPASPVQEPRKNVKTEVASGKEVASPTATHVDSDDDLLPAKRGSTVGSKGKVHRFEKKQDPSGPHKRAEEFASNEKNKPKPGGNDSFGAGIFD